MEFLIVVNDCISNFDLTEYVDRRIVYALAMYQMVQIAITVFQLYTFARDKIDKNTNKEV